MYYINLKNKSKNTEIEENGEEQGEKQENNETKEDLITLHSTLWFVGIELKPNQEAVDLNLTDIILGFTDTSKF